MAHQVLTRNLPISGGLCIFQIFFPYVFFKAVIYLRLLPLFSYPSESFNSVKCMWVCYKLCCLWEHVLVHDVNSSFYRIVTFYIITFWTSLVKTQRPFLGTFQSIFDSVKTALAICFLETGTGILIWYISHYSPPFQQGNNQFFSSIIQKTILYSRMIAYWLMVWLQLTSIY